MFSTCFMYQNVHSFFMAELYSTVCTYHILFIHSSIGGHLGCFHLLGIVNNSEVNIVIQICAYIPAFSSFGDITRSRIAVSYNDSVFKFIWNQLFFIIATPFCIPTINIKGFQFLRILTSADLLFCITANYSRQGASHCNFNAFS